MEKQRGVAMALETVRWRRRLWRNSLFPIQRYTQVWCKGPLSTLDNTEGNQTNFGTHRCLSNGCMNVKQRGHCFTKDLQPNSSSIVYDTQVTGHTDQCSAVGMTNRYKCKYIICIIYGSDYFSTCRKYLQVTNEGWISTIETWKVSPMAELDLTIYLGFPLTQDNPPGCCFCSLHWT